MDKTATKIPAILAISRPLAWIATAASFVIGFLLGGDSGPALWVGLFYFSFCYNILFYGIDQIYRSDHKSQNNLSDSSVTKSAPFVSSQIIWLLVAVFNLPFVIYFGRLGPTSASLGFLALISLVACYSLAGIRLRTIPIIDALIASLYLVGPFVFGLALMGMTNYYWPLILSFFLWGAASHCLTSIVNLKQDRATATLSTATTLGVKQTANLGFWLYIAAASIIAFSYDTVGLIAGLLIGFYALNVSFFKKYKSDAQSHHYKRGLQNFIWLNLVIGLWLVLLLVYRLDLFGLGANKIIITTNVLIGLSIMQTLLIFHNLLGFKRPASTRLEEWPKVSVILHAHNQADNIASTMLALIGQNYPDFEIIFADIASTDNTLKIVEGYEDPRIKTIQLPKRKKDWTLNAYAAQELLGHAAGELVILLSADTILKPNAISTFAALMDNKKLDLMSLLPADQNKTLAQKLILSQNQFLLLGVYPAAYLTKNLPQFASAYAGLMVFDREKIKSIGSFALVKNSPLEDHDLAAQAKLHGLKVGFYLGSDIALSQNHASLKLILEQNIRRYYPMLHFNMPLAVSLFLGGSFFFVGPVVMLFYQIIFHDSQAIIGLLIVIAISLLNRLIIATKTHQSMLGVIIYPLASSVALIEVFFSMLNYELFKPRWLERTEAH